VLYVPYVPFCGIHPLPQIVMHPSGNGSPIKFSIKNDQNFFILGKTPIGIPVV
jgi:hypothetical protein